MERMDRRDFLRTYGFAVAGLAAVAFAGCGEKEPEKPPVKPPVKPPETPETPDVPDEPEEE